MSENETDLTGGERPRAPLGEQVREHFEGIRMDPDAEERLRWMIAGGSSEGKVPPASQRRPPRRPWRSLSVAAALLLALVGGLEMSGYRFGGTADPCARFARTISGQACRQLESEFEAESFAALSRKMDRLGFQLVEPGFLQGTDLRLQGGRYSSVDGELMAEVRLVHEGTGRTCTLFVRRLTTPFTPETRGEFVLDGLEVSVWSEAGLLLGLTRPAKA